jgi:hypothetical protein
LEGATVSLTLAFDGSAVKKGTHHDGIGSKKTRREYTSYNFSGLSIYLLNLLPHETNPFMMELTTKWNA